MITAHTVPGAKRGRLLGFPTLNLVVDEGDLPEEGVYAVRVDGRPAVCHRGPRPTFHDATITCEVFVLDATLPDMPHGTVVHVDFVERLRAVQNFDNAAALHAQIEKDVAAARVIMGSRNL